MHNRSYSSNYKRLFIRIQQNQADTTTTHQSKQKQASSDKHIASLAQICSVHPSINPILTVPATSVSVFGKRWKYQGQLMHLFSVQHRHTWRGWGLSTTIILLSQKLTQVWDFLLDLIILISVSDGLKKSPSASMKHLHTSCPFASSTWLPGFRGSPFLS